MKKTILLLVLCTILIAPNYAQNNNQSELDTLNKEVVTLYKVGNLEAAIKVADKIVELAEKANSTDKRTSAIYLATSARLKKEMFQMLNQKMLTEKMKQDEYTKIFKQANEYAIEADENFEDAIKMFDDLKSDSQQAAFAKTQHAWLLYNHPGKIKRKFVTDPTKLVRFEKAEEMYLQALAIYDKTSGKDSDSSIITSLHTAEFYLNWLKFEKAIPLYERFIQEVEKKYGKDKATIVPALRSLSEIMVTTERPDLAKKLAEQISKITGKKIETLEPNFNLSLRRKYSASKEQVLLETMNPNSLILGSPDSYNNTLAVLRGGRRGEADTRYRFDSNSSFNLKSRNVLVEILVNEKGDVVEAKPMLDKKDARQNEKLIDEAEKAVKDWRFEPFEYNGEKQKMRGFIVYTSTRVD